MVIEQATFADIDSMMSIYRFASEFMSRNGNPHQWINGYPTSELIRSDIENGNSYIFRRDDGNICAAFTFIIGADATYHIIDQGQWLNDEPYGVIHRLASDGSEHGVGRQCLDWCFSRINNIRVDTHKDNLIMQHTLTSYGFSYCGIIYTHNGTERLAYQMKKHEGI
jgi:RimJ/RimL family protein N-acetyltransferase